MPEGLCCFNYFCRFVCIQMHIRVVDDTVCGQHVAACQSHPAVCFSSCQSGCGGTCLLMAHCKRTHAGLGLMLKLELTISSGGVDGGDLREGQSGKSPFQAVCLLTQHSKFIRVTQHMPTAAMGWNPQHVWSCNTQQLPHHSGQRMHGTDGAHCSCSCI